MKRIFLSCVTAACFLPALAFPLGVGELTLESGLNEPFEARIALLSATRDELDSLNIGLADIEAFERAGVDRPFVLSSLHFEVVETEEGADYIRVSSNDSIREPFLNFLVEISWSKGRLYREYTVLLDPPLYDAGPGPVYARPSAPAAEPVAAAPDEPVEAAPSSYAAGPAFSGNEYGPTESADTLWSIAGRTRPDEGVTMQQMMLALLRANPEAFISGNVNGLRRGQVLRIPSRDEIESVSTEQALAEVKSQYALWDDIRGSIAAAPQERPVAGAAVAESTVAAAPASAVVEDTAELRLVAATESGKGTDKSAGATAGAEASQLKDRLAIANEQISAASQENAELKDRLTESEAIIADLKRLIALKDDELAALQQQMSAGAAEVPIAAGSEEEAAKEEAGEAGEGDVEEEIPAALPPEEEGVPPAEEPAPEDAGTVAPEAGPPPVSEAPAGKVAPPAPEPAPAPAEPAPSLLDQALEFVTGNLLYIGAAVVAILLLIGGFTAVSRFRARMEASAAAEPVEELPDFTIDEGETELPVGSEEVTGIKGQPVVAAAPAAATAPAAKEGATVFALPPEPRPKGVAAAKPAAEPEQPAATAEDALDAFHHEVNVLMAYEDWAGAEQFVRDAVGREPKNLDFHAKLLEVFFTSGDRRKYEAAAKTLHDIVGGSGPYWDNAVVMWQEMSPNRALFAEGGEEEEAPAATATGGGLLDLTAAASREDAGLDFDLGEDTAEPAARAASADEPVLDITAGMEEAAAERSASESGDLLDVTAAVGLEPEEASLDLEPGTAGEGVLDLTGEPEPAKPEMLDLSGAGGGLLDVTSQSDVGAQGLEEDLLDVTSTAASAREANEPAAPASGDESAGEHTLDFSLEDLPGTAAGETKAEPESAGPAGNVIEFESAGGGLELDLSAGSRQGSTEETSLGGGLDLDIGDTIAEGAPDAGGLELDLSLDGLQAADAEDSEDGIDMDGTVEIPKLDLAQKPVSADEIDMDGTVKLPKLELELADEDEDEDDGDHTVFVPRSGDAQEQSAEDEIATKLDLAKAYVELGDKESAKGILDQVLADGTDQQKRKAQELIRQMS